MKQSEKQVESERLDPEAAICPAFDSTSIKLFRGPEPGEMGFRVVDNFPEEHIQ